MRLIIIASGRMRFGAVHDLHTHYISHAGRLGRGLGIRGPDVIEIDAVTRRCGGSSQADKFTRALSNLSIGRKLVVLDGEGEPHTSRQFTGLLSRWRDESVPAVAFLIGGADGHAAQMVNKADLILSFGAMTWPHMLIRIMLAEQIYRSFTLLAGHPYHR